MTYDERQKLLKTAMHHAETLEAIVAKIESSIFLTQLNNQEVLREKEYITCGESRSDQRCVRVSSEHDQL